MPLCVAQGYQPAHRASELAHRSYSSLSSVDGLLSFFKRIESQSLDGSQKEKSRGKEFVSRYSLMATNLQNT